MPWLVSLALLDIAMLLVFAFPAAVAATSLTLLMGLRAALMTVLPIVVLLLSGLVPHTVKAMLVFWKVRNVLPGHEAFTRYGPADPRVDMVGLRKNVGVFPVDPAEQNAFWYRLYRRVESEVPVADAHKMYLLWRDAAALSLPLILVVPLLLRWDGATAKAAWIACAIFAAQYFLTAIAARHCGVRFVCNVLAVHSTKRITTPPKA
ncbi:hypothetical protein FAZ95_38725 [Trinickia violacea]|uniref:Glycosyl-4,4'-diaponeurosporenoate acyltransferase n=1 Tax=Trinickia violacea TaxID=2571746 RepID=A0A4P8J2B3_9BURK|nr:hypothetical protein [Trinickia violacea]QCP55077.1 hypothetical protein FAZ95_38725 [Trinickia violacea]